MNANDEMLTVGSWSGARKSAPLPTGHRLGRYQVLRRIAIGGMAEIYLARVAALAGCEKLVVIKRIKPELAGIPEFVEMFLDEARLALSFEHANIVQVYDVGESGGEYYMAMEHLDGDDLFSVASRLRCSGARLPLGAALHIVIAVCDGLHYAHEKRGSDGRPLNLVHRDVSPQNMFVTWDGGVKLLDFGLAKAANRTQQTQAGTLKGKLSYMSPEQSRGLALDRRSDVFSLGIVLWELTVGRRLFAGASDFDVLKRIVEGEVPPPRMFDPDYDPQVEDVVMRALEKDPARRFQTAGELQAALEELAAERHLWLSPASLRTFLRAVRVLVPPSEPQALAAGNEPALEIEISAPWADASELVEVEVEPPPPRNRWRRRAAIATAITAFVGVVAAAAGATLIERARAADPVAPADPLASRETFIGPVSAETIAAPFSPEAIVASLSPNAIVASLSPEVIVVRPEPPAAPVLPEPPAAPLLAEALVATGLPATLVAPALLATLVVPAVAAGPAPSDPSTEPTAADAPLPAATEPPKASGHHRSAAAARTASHHARPATPQPAPVAAPAGDGTLVIASSPWCDVVVDGEARGTTPLTLTLPAGGHTVVLTNPEFHVRRKLPVTVEAGQTLRKKLEFAF